jgi:hypothetical protein
MLRMGENEMVRSWVFTGKLRVQVQVKFDVDKVAQEQVPPPPSRVSPVFLLQSSFHLCSTLIYHRPLMCAIALITQHSITSSVFKLGASTLNRYLAG